MQKRCIAVMVAAMVLGFSLSVPLGVWLMAHTTPAYAAPPKAECTGGLTAVLVTPGSAPDTNGDGIVCAKDNPTPNKT